MVLALIMTSLMTYVAWNVICLQINARTARKLKVPAVCIPFDVNNNIWVILQPLVWRALARLPVSWAAYPDFVRFSHRNWHFLEKSSPIVRFGPVWALVSPGGVHLHVSDPESIQNIFMRFRDFYRPIHKYQMLSIFGQNVFTVGVNDWLRHRKAVAKPLHEITMNFVWHESLRQTRGMLHLWTSASHGGTTQMLEDLRNLSLNVLVAAAYGKSSDFTRFDDGGHEDVAEFRNAMFTVQRNAITMMLAPRWLLSGPLAPKHLAKIGHAAKYLKEHMMKTISEETESHSPGEPVPAGLVSGLVRASHHSMAKVTQNDEKNEFSDTQRIDGLSNDEILGNMFVIDFAGYDTTANTLSFTLILLAANPHVQEWVAEEVKALCHGINSKEWSYDLFSKMKRCQALFLETLRTYPPITGLPKMAIRTTQTLRVGNRLVAIPPGTETFPLLLGVQTDPTHWTKPFEWNPSRWISRQESSNGAVVEENLLVPKKGTFFPWSDGPQGCVGKKFAEVEGSAMLACLLQRHRIRVKVRSGETEAQARKRAKDCADDVNYQLLLKMNDTTKVELECFETAVQC